MLKLAVLISGNGSNLQALIDAIAAKQLDANIHTVISDNPDAFGLQRAQEANIPAIHISPTDKKTFETALLTTLQKYSPDLIVLAGFMRILSVKIIQTYPNKIINIHPSLLPKYPGLNTYERVLAAGDLVHGTTVHFVTEQVDQGKIIAQQSVPILLNESVTTLKQKIQAIEHRLYPKVIQSIAKKHLQLSEN